MRQNLVYGVVTDDYNVVIETVATENGNFICNLTRVLPDLEESVSKSDVHSEDVFFANTSDVTIYAFDSFDDFIEFCSFFEKNFVGDKEIFSANSKLVFYDYKYFLVIYDVCTNLDFLRSFCACISEFGEFVSSSNALASKFLEFGNLLIENNAILDIAVKFK